MITYFQAIILGFLQGISELFPISSLGHSVIFPRLFGWNIHQDASYFLTFLVATHFATALVLFLFFWKDWKRILQGIFRSLKEREIKESDTDAKLGWLLVVGTIPAGILGILFQDSLKAFFSSPQIVAFFLIANGVMLFLGEMLRRKKSFGIVRETEGRIAKTSWAQAVGVGASQSLALFPGFSRTGSTLVGGLLVGLSHEDAVRYSFLLATPIIAAAALLKLPELFTIPSENLFLGQTLAGTICAGIAAYFSVRFLTKYFETKNLIPFALYCVIFGVFSSAVFLFGR